MAGLKTIYQPGYKLANAGVMLMDLQDDMVEQGELDLEADAGTNRSNLLSALDELNGRYGRGTLLMASAGLDGKRRVWSMKQEGRTPRYTTCWDEMLVVRA